MPSGQNDELIQLTVKKTSKISHYLFPYEYELYISEYACHSSAESGTV